MWHEAPLLISDYEAFSPSGCFSVFSFYYNPSVPIPMSHLRLDARIKELSCREERKKKRMNEEINYMKNIKSESKSKRGCISFKEMRIYF